MKILHFIPSIDRSSGGVGAYIQLLASELGLLVELHVVSHLEENPLPINNCTIHYVDKYIINGKMKKQYLALLHQVHPDVVHINCCWNPECSLIQKWSYQQGYKTVYTPHGMLEPWILKRHYWTKKFPALLLYQRAAIRHSTILHATAESEMQNLLNLGYNKNVAVIANGIDVSSISMKQEWRKRKTILFLSRIHVKKGINFLIEAIAELKDMMKGYRVIIAGEGEESYIEHLKRYAIEMGVAEMFDFVGGVYGEEKWHYFQDADLFVLPTHSENFGIVVAEALASGTPVITTKGTPWHELESYNCGWWTEVGKEPTKAAILEFLNKDVKELRIMGINGRKLIEEKYGSSTIAKKMAELYSWLNGNGNKPNFIHVV